MAHVGVNAIRKVNRRRAHRQLDDLVARRIHIDVIPHHLGLERGQELGRVAQFADRLGAKLAQVVYRLFQLGACSRPLALSHIRNDPQLRRRVHPHRPDLELYRDFVDEHGGVQGLIPVCQRSRDIVARLAGNGRPSGVDRCHGQVARGDILYDQVEPQLGWNALELAQRGVRRLLQAPEHVIHAPGIRAHAALLDLDPPVREHVEHLCRNVLDLSVVLLIPLLNG